MIALWLSPIYLLLHIYLAFRILHWAAAVHPVLGSIWFILPFLVCYAMVTVSPLPAAFGRRKLKIIFKKISSWWLGTLLYLLLFLLLADFGKALCRLLQQRPLFAASDPSVIRISGFLVAGGTMLLSFYGSRNAGNLKKAAYHVTIHKACPIPGLKIALLADLHMGGAVGLRHMQKVYTALKNMQPDMIILAGDIFDNDFATIDEPEKICGLFKRLRTKYGTYACWGNHDISEVILAGFTFDTGDKNTGSDPRMEQFLKESGIRLLKDETVLIDNAFYLCGRLDASCKEKSGTIRLTPSELTAALDHSRPILVIDHQPSELYELAEAGVDLDLSGHTHAGQIFPGNLTANILWKNPWGRMDIRNMTSIVTAGAGTWGPAQRIATCSEVVEIHVDFING